jgi:hypothetical protein
MMVSFQTLVYFLSVIEYIDLTIPGEIEEMRFEEACIMIK